MVGQVLVAPGGFHMLFDENEKVTLNQKPAVHGVRPAVDVTLNSLNKHFGKNMIGVILTGMGSLSYGEQAGERMKLGLMLNDPEEEHDCFSDNTPDSHFHDGLGVQNVYLGRYVRTDGSVVKGPALADLVAAADPALDARLKAELDATLAALDAIRAAAEGGMAYDQMLAPDNAAGEALILAGVDALVAQTRSIERAVAALGLSKIAFEGSDSLDNPGAVFQ